MFHLIIYVYFSHFYTHETLRNFRHTHSLEASSIFLSFFLMVQLSIPYVTIGKTDVPAIFILVCLVTFLSLRILSDFLHDTSLDFLLTHAILGVQ